MKKLNILLPDRKGFKDKRKTKHFLKFKENGALNYKYHQRSIRNPNTSFGDNQPEKRNKTISFVHNKSLMKKSIFAQALNIIVGPMITTFVNRKSFYGTNGLANIVLYYQFIMFIMMLFYYVINPFYLTKWLIINVRLFRNKMIRQLCEVVG